MSMSHTPERPVPHHTAYGPLRRMKTAYRFIRQMARLGNAELERTQSRHVGPTYGISVEFVKRMKAKFRNELSSSGGDK